MARARQRSPDRPSAVDADGVIAWRGDRAIRREDQTAAEEPLEIRLAGCNVAVTMRTPGDDLDLATGFLFTEGIIRGFDDIGNLAYCPSDDPRAAGNVVNVNPTDPALVDPDRWQRHFFAASSCGVCGKASIDQVRRDILAIDSSAHVSPDVLYRLAGSLCGVQQVFAATGGLHAAGLYDTAGNLLCLREDIGRHNAVDKVIGDAVRHNRLPLTDRILLVSGRVSFEVVQKALAASIPILAAVSAPSSLAVELARSTGMTLVGFLRIEPTPRFNVYSGAERVGDPLGGCLV